MRGCGPWEQAVIEFGYVHAFRGAFLKGLREGRDFDSFLMGLATGVPTAAVVAWVANSRGDEAPSGTWLGCIRSRAS